MGSPEQDKVVAAMAVCLAEIEDLKRTKEATIPTKSGGTFSYKYADLADVFQYARPLLAKHGLAATQSAMSSNGKPAVRTTILHVSGQWWTTEPLELADYGSDARALGSAITYGRRYSLTATLGLATEDDDGAAASQSRPSSPKRARSRGETHPSADSPPLPPAEGETSGVRAIMASLPGPQRVKVTQMARDAGVNDIYRAEHEEVVLGLIAQVKEDAGG